MAVAHPSVDLPLVDLEAEPSGDPELRRGLFETGFFLLRDHVIPRHLLDQVRETTLAFMEKPDEAKRRWHGPMRGWVPFRDESASAGFGYGEAGGEQGDACQKYSMGPIVSRAARAADPARREVPAGAHYFAPNVFPNEEMRAAWEAYYRRMEALCTRMLEAVRIALGLPAASWRALTSDPVSVLRFLDYPDLAGGIRMGAHLDDTLITVLHQSVPANGFAALQVRLPGEDGWRSVTPSDDVFVVNVGETLTFLSGGRVVATRHRVVAAPPGLAEGSARTSLVYFHLPNWDARMRPAKWNGPRGQRTRFDREELREPDGSVVFYKAHELGVEGLVRGGKGTPG